MNNIVRLIFNEKIVEKRGLWVLSIVHGTHWNCVSVLKRASKKKKGKREVSAFQHYPNAHLICVRIEIILPTSVFFFFFLPTPLVLFMGYEQCIKANVQCLGSEQ